jgi:tRNA (guanine37-N1)-methyltransferase
MGVPEALMSGNHEQIRRWRRQRALEKTFRNRPDLLEGATLSEEDEKFLAGITNTGNRKQKACESGKDRG